MFAKRAVPGRTGVLAAALVAMMTAAAGPAAATYVYTYKFVPNTTIDFYGNFNRPGQFFDGRVTVTGKFSIEQLSPNTFSETVITPVVLSGAGVAAHTFDLGSSPVLDFGGNAIYFAFDNGVTSGTLSLYFAADLVNGPAGTTALVSNPSYLEALVPAGPSYNQRFGQNLHGGVILDSVVDVTTPEPASFAMLAMGLGLLGLAKFPLRRHEGTS